MTEKNVQKVENCKYMLPCGWCDRKNATCDMLNTTEGINEASTKDTKEFDIDSYIKQTQIDTSADKAICIHDWVPMNTINSTGVYSYRCRKCGAIDNQYVPQGITTKGKFDYAKDYILGYNAIPDPCMKCSNHPINGGTGICNCTLGLPSVTAINNITGTVSSNAANKEPDWSNTHTTVTNTNLTANSVCNKEEFEQLTINFEEQL